MGPKIDINQFILPCHFCDSTCKTFKNGFLEFDCLTVGHQFIDEQSSLIEKLLAVHEGIKIFSYGKSDIFQLEQSSNFFSDSSEHREYLRRNRKMSKRLTDISIDLSDGNDESLTDIEKVHLKNWIPGWSRGLHYKTRKRFMTKINSPNWKNNYSTVLKTCTEDAVSAFLFLLYKNYQ